MKSLIAIFSLILSASVMAGMCDGFEFDEQTARSSIADASHSDPSERSYSDWDKCFLIYDCEENSTCQTLQEKLSTLLGNPSFDALKPEPKKQASWKCTLGNQLDNVK